MSNLTIDNLKDEIENLKKTIELINNKINPTIKTDDNDKKNYMVNWYKKNKEKHLEKLKNKSKCECGDLVSYGNRIRHLTTPKHTKRMNKQTVNIEL